MNNVTLAAVLVLSLAAPAFAATTMAKPEDAKGMMMHASNGTATQDKHGCLVMLSADKNNIMMMNKGAMMMGDRKTHMMYMMKDGKAMPVKMGTPEAKMMQEHMQMMM